MAFGEVWIWKARPYAPSQCRTTWVMVAVAPRSTWIHWGSLNWLDQRVPVLPSTAFAAPTSAPSCDEAVAGLPWERRVSAAPAWVMPATVRPSAVASAATKTVSLRRLRRMTSDVMVLPVGTRWRRPAGETGRDAGDGERGGHWGSRSNLESALQARWIVTPVLRLVNMLAVPEMNNGEVRRRREWHIDTFARYVNTSPVIARRHLPLLLAALCLGACEAGTPATRPPAPPAVSSAAAFGGTDRAWVEINIAMGEELLPLLALAPAKSRDPGVRTLAAEVKTLHEKELATLYRLHDAAGLPAENPHKGMPMPGMVTPEQVSEAAAVSGPAFDALLLKHLREHLDQGVRLATSEEKSGVQPQTRALAAQMIADRTEMTDRVRRTGT